MITDVTACGATAVACVCVKPLGHVDQGDPEHACGAPGAFGPCRAVWTGDYAGDDFAPVVFPMGERA